MPTYSRITVGTHEEMAMFRDAWHEVMKGAVSAQVGELEPKPWRSLDGVEFATLTPVFPESTTTVCSNVSA